MEYNKSINIYSKKSYGQLSFHIQDSINVASFIKESRIHVDFGSGAGLPGIIIAMHNLGQVFCIESKEKKRNFLRLVKKELSLQNLEVYDGDVQQFAKRYSGLKINSFSAKAFAKPPKLIWYLSLFRSYVNSKTICWVPISELQVQVLKKIGPIKTLSINQREFNYFKILMADLRYYKEGLKTQYNL